MSIPIKSPMTVSVDTETITIPMTLDTEINIQDISGKADRVVGAVAGNFAGLDENGNLIDSGKKASDFATPEDISGFYTKPNGGIPATDLESEVQSSLDLADTAYQKPNGGIPSTDLASDIQSSLDLADTAYQKPNGGIPSTDLASDIQSSLDLADTAYQKPNGGIPSTDLASDIQSSLDLADTAYQKPNGGIPSTDLASDIQSSLDLADTAYQKPNSGIPSTDLASDIQSSLDLADTAYQKPNGGIPSTDLASDIRSSLDLADTAYQKPNSGIPSTDLASDIQSSLDLADTAYQKPNSGIPSTDLASDIQSSLDLADTAYQKPSGGIPATDLASGVIPSVPVQDVQVNGTSVLNNGVANVPIASDSAPGVVGISGGSVYGVRLATADNKTLATRGADDNQIKAGTQGYCPITPGKQHASTFYGLAKAAGDSTQSASNNAVGTYTDEAKTAIKSMIGITDPAVSDVQVNGASVLNNGVANVPMASQNTLGAVRIQDSEGISIYSGGILYINPATATEIKIGTNYVKPITPVREHYAAFYGLAKAAGDSTQSASSNPAGTYTDEAKAAIKSMIGVTDDISDLKNSKAPVIIDSAEGSIVSIPDGADNLPVEHCVVSIEPTQDLHGYDNPWPYGANTNLIPMGQDTNNGFVDNCVLQVNGNPAENTTAFVSEYFPVTAEESYTLSSITALVSPSVCFYDSSKQYISGVNFNDSTQVQITTPVGAAYARCTQYKSGSNRIQFEKGTTATTPILPSSNICPISGASSVNVCRTGKNLIEYEVGDTKSARGVDYTVLSDGGVNCHGTASDGTSYGVASISHNLKAGTYTLSTTGATNVVTVCVKNGSYWFEISGSGNSTKTLTVDAEIHCYVFVPNGIEVDETVYVQLELGSAATAYEPYAGNSYPVTFPDTVYGGTLNLTTGLLTVTQVKVAAGASKATTFNYDGNRVIASVAGFGYGSPKAEQQLVPFNYVKSSTSSTVWNGYLNVYGNLIVYIPDTITSYSDWADYITEHPLEFVYELATPYTVQLSTTEIKTLLGLNNIWADAGDVEVAYRADTKLFCQKNNTVDDVRVNGVSVVQNGIANVPYGTTSTFGVLAVGNGLRISGTNSKALIDNAGSAKIKAGTEAYNPIVPLRQDESTFYGLAKAAGADMASSSNAVGTYTDAAKIAIQKMLGIYEAPWELIREDTFTNATEADHIITVDGNGQAFELTDAIVLFELPTDSSYAAKGYYGQIWFYYNNDTGHLEPEPGAYTRNADGATVGAWYRVLYENGLVKTDYTAATTNTNSGNVRMRFIQDTNPVADTAMGIFLIDNFAISKINIKSVTGTGHYKLYGKRKWN